MTTNNTGGAALLPVTLKPCPLCDGEAFMQDEHWRDGTLRGREPICSQCGLKMPKYWPKRAEVEAIAAWNTRAPLPATQEDAERSVVVTQEDVDAALATFDGGLRRQSDERNARGYTTFYHPKDSMRAALEEFSARHHTALSTPQRQEYDGEAVREALKTVIRKIRAQALCLEHYAEQNGFPAKPMPSVFHLQATHFRDFADEAAAALNPAQARDEMREALERLSKLTPFTANAATADDFAATVHAIVDTALSSDKGEER